ncbi:MAG: triphosphoribosyl-dephospho-CoA synthase [Saccharolobus sp.]
MIEKSEVLSDLCNEISFILSNATLTESYIFKPGNASRFQDLNNVKYIDLNRSAVLSSNYYKELCIRGYKGVKKIYDTILNIVKQSKKLGFEYQLFGTYLLLAPIAYKAITSYDIFDLRNRVSQTIRSLESVETRWFLEALKAQNLTYLGKLNKMDYRDLTSIGFYELMTFSSRYDLVAYNIINNYSITFEAFYIINENKCGFEKDVQRAFIKILANYPDTLIFKKYGASSALKVSKMAMLISDCPSDDELKSFNNFLTTNNLNPGTTADLIASALAIYYLDEWYKKDSSHIWTIMQDRCDRETK